MKKQLLTYLALITLLILAIMVPTAGAYDTYSAGCGNCHGNFRANTYNSLAAVKAANPAWPGTSLALHNGHANTSTATPPGMLNDNCNACHSGANRLPVYTYQSDGTAPFNLGCSGCHDGPGLRAHHVNSGADTCYDCHSDPIPDSENVLRPVYAAAFGTTSGTTMVNDPCNPAAAGFEGRLKDITGLGLDNDGNLLYDYNDPACAVNAAILNVSPTALSFSNQAVGTSSATQTVAISNTGNAVLSVTGLTNSNTTDYTLTAPSVPFNVAAGGTQTFTVSFRPGSAGAKSSTVSLASSAGNASVTSTGTAIAPILAVSPPTLTFGSQTISSVSAAQTITLSNTGTGPLTVSGITSTNAEFAFSPTSITPIAAGGSATLSVTFAPAASGVRSSNISIYSDGSNAIVSASGTGVTTAALSVSPAILTYANQDVGTTSATQTVTISNNGGAALTVNSITNSNTTDFVLTASATPLIVNGGASQTFTVAFGPASSGAKTATLTISSTAGNAAVSASGTGSTVTVLQPVINVSPLSLAFSDVTVNTTSSRTVTISNTGNAPLSITNLSKSGSAAFSFSPTSFSAITSGSSATLTVTYAPTVAGTDSGTKINFTSNGGGAAVSLMGNALQPSTPTSGDVALIKLSVPGKVTVRLGESLEIQALAQATTTTNNGIDATVTLKTGYNRNVKVKVENTMSTNKMSAGKSDPQNFNFKANISCSQIGTWPVTWTATISSAKNSNTKNDTLTATTQVTCSGKSRSSSGDGLSTSNR